MVAGFFKRGGFQRVYFYLLDLLLYAFEYDWNCLSGVLLWVHVVDLFRDIFGRFGVLI